jgi:hypothetical protein
MSTEPLFIHVYDCLTGETTEREMTPEEVTEREALIPNAPVLPSPE